MTEPLIDKIKSRGYWKVVIRPLEFKKERIESISDCADIVDKSAVRLRGWPYPYVKPNKIEVGIDWVQCRVDWQNYIEYWRMYQSGQFAQWFACREDWWGESTWVPENLRATAPMSVMSVLMTLFSLTEIYEFTARVAEKKIFDEALSLNVELHGMKDRQLIFLEPFRHMFDKYRCAIDILPFHKIISIDEILAAAPDLALDHTLWIFERFNWKSIRKDILKSDQEKLLHKKL